jgi:hypothetical protein
MSNEVPEQEPKPIAAPHTHADAKVVEWRTVTNARVAHIEKVAYRTAEFGGVFLLANNPTCYYEDKFQLKVVMKWFDWEPSTGACRITPLTEVTYEENYSGSVIAKVAVEGWQAGSQ